jgi:hypothetical protein
MAGSSFLLSGIDGLTTRQKGSIVNGCGLSMSRLLMVFTFPFALQIADVSIKRRVQINKQLAWHFGGY